MLCGSDYMFERTACGILQVLNPKRELRMDGRSEVSFPISVSLSRSLLLLN